MKETIGLVGAGLLGSELGKRLLAGGYRLLVHDLDLRRARALARPAAENAQEVARECRRIVLCLPGSPIVRTVVNSLALRGGQVLVDTTTGDPEDAEALGSILAKKGVHYLDATIAASSAQVRQGEGLILVGGRRSVFNSCKDLLGAIAPRAVWLGAFGRGARMKLVHNLVLGLNRAALAEGLAFAKGLGLDPARVLAVLKESPAASRIMEGKGLKMVGGNFAPEAKLAQHLKDVRLILTGARRADLALPLSRAHRRILEQAVDAGFGDLDNSAIIKTYDHA